jgi:hypothetical protein
VEEASATSRNRRSRRYVATTEAPKLNEQFFHAWRWEQVPRPAGPQFGASADFVMQASFTAR